MNTDEYMQGLKSMSITLSEQQLTDTVEYVTADNYVKVNDAVNGNYYNYQFRYKVSKSTRKGRLQTCECMADIDELLYTPVNYNISDRENRTQLIRYANPDGTSTYVKKEIEDENEEAETKPASHHIAKIAEQLGKNLVSRFRDFDSTMEVEQKDVTYADLISELFGWTARIPNFMINCHLVGDTLYVIQRGFEPNTIDITNTKHTLPTIVEEIERLTWGSSPDSKTTVTKKIYGITYTWKEKNNSEDGKSKFKYNKDRLLEQKLVQNDDGSSIETTYFYKMVDGSRFLYYEREVRKEKEYDNDPTITETYHTSLGQGQRSSSVYRDGEYVGSAVGNTSGDDSASDYITKRAVLREPKEEEETTTIPGNTLIDPSFPIAGDDELEVVTAALKWLNRKIKETVTMDIYDLEHIINFEDKIVFEGNEYHLQSNTVEKSKIIYNKQSISIVRWHE